MSPALQRANLPALFIFTLQGMTTSTWEMAKDAHYGNRNNAHCTNMLPSESKASFFPFCTPFFYHQ